MFHLGKIIINDLTSKYLGAFCNIFIKIIGLSQKKISYFGTKEKNTQIV